MSSRCAPALHYKVSGIGRSRLPTVGSNQELAGESACPTFFMKFRGRGYFRKTNHSLAAKFSSEHSAMARPLAK